MKLLPNIQLPQLPPVSSAAAAVNGAGGMDSRLGTAGISLPFSPTDLLWRYGPMTFSPTAHPPPSPLLDFKTHLPTTLGKFPLPFVQLLGRIQVQWGPTVLSIGTRFLCEKLRDSFDLLLCCYTG